ncbi:MAG: hypothetical protein HYX41_03880 [Bdellovibrio sp.]|nr:hypothetical protein [Bdellovibrio sp.]
MYIGRVWLLVVFLLFCLSFSALAVSPSSSELWENVRFVHLTDVIRNSTVVPGASSLVTLAHPQPLPQSFLFDLEDGVAPFYVAHWGHQKKFHIVDVNQLLPPQRITSHWHVYEGVHDAVDGKNWNDRKVAIVERAKYFKGQLYGGTNRDFMVIGPHRLSRESYIIAPRSLERTLRLGNPQYEGHWWFYEDSEHRNAAEAVDFLNTLFKNVNSKDWVITSERKPSSLSLIKKWLNITGVCQALLSLLSLVKS